MKTLIVMRHAKAEQPAVRQSDKERRLNERGRSDATAIALRLAALGYGALDRALVSTAARTRETWERLAPVVTANSIAFADALYLAEADVLADAVRAAAAYDRVLLVGHNPGLKALAACFVQSPLPHDADAALRLQGGLPTANALVFDVEDEPVPGRARLAGWLRPETG